MSNQSPVRVNRIASLIRTIRGTRRLNEQVKRNARRFPADFVFPLSDKEAKALFAMRSQIATASGTPRGLRSQFVTAYKRNVRFLPYAFTEKGAVMAANVLSSPEAVRMSIFVVRAFIEMRELLGGTKELARQLAALEKKLTARLDGHEVAIVEVLRRVMDILDPPPAPPERPRRRIGFHVAPEDQPESRARKMR